MIFNFSRLLDSRFLCIQTLQWFSLALLIRFLLVCSCHFYPSVTVYLVQRVCFYLLSGCSSFYLLFSIQPTLYFICKLEVWDQSFPRAFSSVLFFPCQLAIQHIQPPNKHKETQVDVGQKKKLNTINKSSQSKREFYCYRNPLSKANPSRLNVERLTLNMLSTAAQQGALLVSSMTLQFSLSP